MKVFLPCAAMFIGLANAGLYSLISDNTLDDFFEWRPEPPSLLAMYALCAVFVGLLVSGVLLSFAERDLRGSFFARYGLMVLSVCAGGAILATFLTTVTFYFDTGAYKPRSAAEFLSGVAFSALPGGVLGATEGVVLGFPLAGGLGMLRDRTAAQAEGRS